MNHRAKKNTPSCYANFASTKRDSLVVRIFYSTLSSAADPILSKYKSGETIVSTSSHYSHTKESLHDALSPKWNYQVILW